MGLEDPMKIQAKSQPEKPEMENRSFFCHGFFVHPSSRSKVLTPAVPIAAAPAPAPQLMQQKQRDLRPVGSVQRTAVSRILQGLVF